MKTNRAYFNKVARIIRKTPGYYAHLGEEDYTLHFYREDHRIKSLVVMSDCGVTWKPDQDCLTPRYGLIRVPYGEVAVPSADETAAILIKFLDLAKEGFVPASCEDDEFQPLFDGDLEFKPNDDDENWWWLLGAGLDLASPFVTEKRGGRCWQPENTHGEKKMFSARISDGETSGKLFSGKQAVSLMKKAAIDAKKGKGAFRLELSKNNRLCVEAYGKTAVEAASYGAAIHRKGIRERSIGRRKYLKTPRITCEGIMYFVELSKDGKTAFSKYYAGLQFRKTKNGDWRSNR